MTVPDASLSPLYRADGSATYSADGYTVVGAVNGPIEVQRREELPDQATIEVNVRPAVGVGSTKERHLESILHSTFRRIILTHAFPRSLIQLTLQVVSSPEQHEYRYCTSNLPILPALLQAGMLTILSSSLPLECTFTSVALAVRPDKAGGIVELESNNSAIAESIHVFAFTSAGRLLLSESEGSFTMQQWEAAHDRAKIICCAESARGDRMPVDGLKQEASRKQWMRDLIEGQVEQDKAREA